MKPTAYETGYDLLAETCRERWARQFEPVTHSIAAKVTPSWFGLPDHGDLDRYVEEWLRIRNPRAWLDSLPPPTPGSHESRILGVREVWPYRSPGKDYEASCAEYLVAAAWAQADLRGAR